ncbi:MAG: tRNA adenylyl-/cytidylyl-transferase [Candidatus Gottesmanbacteria bacterium GW2011_GWB1_43_11]|uniref:tRNA adenylyl-/cytidylyl-transferase n=1 Tax=Candidatus Gottesmanbacteria bacterium GW2011_GWB1_43_11 TaxID=1618446 RepID=A0A0G1CND5_9BACT|nr:MAG: tRNA adenylyl-/cytidylyl-transferase [Candidatus Gottesmanbacteria bacterium GW2011_GWA2_42_16]KKS55919.1 MAG: tRNA adenylyl-/cytidylyl-transferase [Candidatus Gottesmanbacteria bacterium GW2011_GWA1_42_26]KKS81730.1 MAG: tRNA adenylyl-/cytidylyl-transferase [Candidatus Gottesmanbacteria bacterium GW2011_GWC1_43_10]KKS87007.1 MAG: tRNA adenylyl-/cytidylyl-transferase [Candidatus Gottesmanbacteria bacterium GW2011_GWB1_43_11]
MGGSVRDLLLKRKTHGWDFTTNATPAHILALFPDSFYDNQFGTVGIKIKASSVKDKALSEETIDVYEVTTYRSESGYRDHRHPDEVVWGTTLEEDLSRRDLTINAIAFDGEKIIDPYQGETDLKNKLVRAVGDPETRFKEDALRLLRTIRIATQLGFTIEPQTFSAIQQHTQLIKQVSADRIRHELMRIMESAYPADGVLVLKNSGLLAEILPELDQAFGVPQKSPGRHHIYDVGTHLIESLRHCPSKNPLVRFATLLHDIGKPAVFRQNPQTKQITFYNHEVTGMTIAKNICLRLNFSNRDREKIVTLVRWHQFTVDENQTDATLRRFIKRVGIENLQDILDLRIGDRVGSGAAITSWRLRLYMKRLEEVQKQPFTVADLKVDGHDVMKIFDISPGPKIGKILDQLFNEVITQKLPNEREPLLKRLTEIK